MDDVYEMTAMIPAHCWQKSSTMGIKSAFRIPGVRQIFDNFPVIDNSSS
jgi:hypothetical protein